MSFTLRIRGMMSHVGMGVLRAARGQSGVEKQDLVSERSVRQRKRRRKRRPPLDQNPLTGDPSEPDGTKCRPDEERRVDIII